MKVEILLIALLFSVSLNALITALNARGSIRMILSYFFAFLCFGVAVFFAIQSQSNSPSLAPLVSIEQPTKNLTTMPEKVEAAPIMELPATSSSPSHEGIIIAPSAIDSQSIVASHNDAAVGEAKQQLKNILEAALRMQRVLSALNTEGISELSDQEYEQTQSKAAGFVTEARKIRDRAIAIGKVPEAVKDAKETLEKGLENLVAAATNYERFFKSENKTEEEERDSAFRKAAVSSAGLFKRAGDLIAK